jgi:ribonucleoside-triphosphate reductase (formate)
MHNWSTRAELIYFRTYSRPKDDGTFETWPETIDRVIQHQEWLWHRAKRNRLNEREKAELEELRTLLLDRRVFVAGRTLWLGGTDISKKRQSSQFNCSFLEVRDAWDVVDALWLLLQGCGVGFAPVPGALNGFARPFETLRIVRSTRTEKGGRDTNQETWDPDTATWTLSIGDSAEAWAKSIGKLVSHKYPAKHLVLDFSELRPAGERLKGYGWISQGDEAIAKAYADIAGILNRRAGQLLSRLDILDLVNHLGTVLSTRRSAEIALCPYGVGDWEAFATAKKEYWLSGNNQRSQSNNSLTFSNQPTQGQLDELLSLMLSSGGSEPGLINAEASLRRFPGWRGTNPCAEILLPNNGFCNLVSVDVAKFKDNWAGLLRAFQVIARANYRQTCVDLEDGLLQAAWHENNQFFRLCGVSMTGIARRPDLANPFALKQLRNAAITGAYSMALDLDMPLPKNVTTIKPEGTTSKLADTTEGIHTPLGRYIFNNIGFSKHDPLVDKLRKGGYTVFDHPLDPTGVIVTFPVDWSDISFSRVGDLEVNQESAIAQLERYKLFMDNYVEHNASITVSYDREEIPEVARWLHRNWDHYVGVSFLPRLDPTKTAQDLGYPYLPQQVVGAKEFNNYVEGLHPLDMVEGSVEMLDDEACAGGVCPVR